VSIAAAMLHTRPLPTASPLLYSLHFFTLIYSSDSDTREGYSCPDVKRARTRSPPRGDLPRLRDIYFVLTEYRRCDLTRRHVRVNAYVSGSLHFSQERLRRLIRLTIGRSSLEDCWELTCYSSLRKLSQTCLTSITECRFEVFSLH